ncbi:hypothetical protein GGI15_001290 [Coemansia interrupta]|uniref:Maleylacetoacetate isomerase n=1 Tax=Coemansia interrupta TaxID=1126814 RepID=A0A9W8HQH1_9FUNG|nr:hypothetical protein GGI15_001290 [Coemansia interrupta]
MSQPRPILYTYFRSSCSARVRIALNYKGIDYDSRAVNLVKGEHTSDDYTELNPGKLLPYLVIDGEGLSQSVAIMEYLDEVYPDKPLLPQDPGQRAKVRAIVNAISCDIQPLQNMRVLLTLPEEQRAEYACKIISTGLAVVERMLEKTAGDFCVGNQVTMADCCLIPQLYNAHRFNVDLSAMPHIRAIEERANALEAFRCAHWSRQPDCPDDLRSSAKN